MDTTKQTAPALTAQGRQENQGYGHTNNSTDRAPGSRGVR